MEPPPGARPIFLGIECGGTRTVALLVDARGAVLRRVQSGAANLRLTRDSELTALFRGIRGQCSAASSVGAGLAGVRTEDDKARALRVMAQVWPRVPLWAGHDLETALAAAAPELDDWLAPPRTRRPGRRFDAQVVVESGTGSCCFGRSLRGEEAKAGGWGHILGDRGSGYDIAHRALQAAIACLDRRREWPAVGRRILRALQLNDPEQLVQWAQEASKSAVAKLAAEVFAAAEEGDRIARGVLDAALDALATDAAACATRLAAKNAAVQFVLAGSVFAHQKRFSASLGRRLRAQLPRSRTCLLERETVWGAVACARRQWEASNGRGASRPVPPRGHAAPTAAEVDDAASTEKKQLSPTEQRNPRSMRLDRLSVAEIAKLMLSEEARVPALVQAEHRSLVRAINLIVRAFRQGGRLFYVGAGTSGRLGVLDASECPPTFRTRPEQVQAIMAGGASALWQSVEGAEDDPAAGAAAVKFRGVTETDVTVGIAASGRTPFVLGALAEAKRRGAKTVLICFNPSVELPRSSKPNVTIAPDTGPEVLTGSTRLKAGTATKLILNLLTTASMIKLGKVRSNLMIDLHPSNTKLRARAIRIVREIAGCDAPAARGALEASGWVIQSALETLGASGK